MTTTSHQSITDLRNFVLQQASDDAGLPPADRKWQAEVVAEVLGQEPLEPAIFKRLFGEYTNQIALSNQN